MEARLNKSGSEPDFSHPIFDPVRPWLDRLDGSPSLEILNIFSQEIDLRTESGKPVRFVPPSSADPYYEVQVFETGRVQTRAESRHDLFNALAWLAYPRTKARINALHAAQIPHEAGKRGRLRDLLTLFDEGGAIVECAGPALAQMIRQFRWTDLFWENRSRLRRGLRIHVLGHAVLETALAPWPGITCKVIFVPVGIEPDAAAADWLRADRRPQELSALPVFGYPGWFPGNDRAQFYADERHFRPLRRDLPKGNRAPTPISQGNAGKRVS